PAVRGPGGRRPERFPAAAALPRVRGRAGPDRRCHPARRAADRLRRAIGRSRFQSRRDRPRYIRRRCPRCECWPRCPPSALDRRAAERWRSRQPGRKWKKRKSKKRRAPGSAPAHFSLFAFSAFLSLRQASLFFQGLAVPDFATSAVLSVAGFPSLSHAWPHVAYLPRRREELSQGAAGGRFTDAKLCGDCRGVIPFPQQLQHALIKLG